MLLPWQACWGAPWQDCCDPPKDQSLAELSVAVRQTDNKLRTLDAASR